MTHDHHPHHHTNQLHGPKLLWVTLLNAVITLTELVGGLLSNSLSLLSDAIHNLGDTSALLFAYIANRWGNKSANMRHTFGYKRVEIITAFFNALVLIIICLFLLKEAYERLLNPEPIKGALMLGVAIVGLVANWVSVLILQNDKNKNINIKAAYLHLLGDTLSSVAVIIGGIAIWRWNVVWLDPIITVAVSLYIIYHTWHVLIQAIDILMQSTPKAVDLEALLEEIEEIPEVSDIHHLHVWQLYEDQTHFEAHINVRDNVDMVRLTAIRCSIERVLGRYHIHHSTLQMEFDCCSDNKALIVNENR